MAETEKVELWDNPDTTVTGKTTRGRAEGNQSQRTGNWVNGSFIPVNPAVNREDKSSKGADRKGNGTPIYRYPGPKITDRIL